MRALILPRTVSFEESETPLELVELPIPKPGPEELLLKVAACGVCHTELDEIEGRTAPPRFPVVPGHEVVGRVAAMGRNAGGFFKEGTRVGVGWIHSSDGGEDENVSERFVATGRDVNGGYAEYMTVPATYAYPIPDVFSDVQAAPLLCAGAIGYRALRLSRIENGQRLGLTGFGGSAHLVLPLCRHLYPETSIYVFARDPAARAFALESGADWAGDTADRPPEKLHAIIDTTPAWKPVVEALACLRPCGRLVINAIRKESRDHEYLRHLRYDEHLWMEREIKSVANITHHDIKAFLPIAGQIPMRPEIEVYRLEEANRALTALKCGPVRGAKVLRVDE